MDMSRVAVALHWEPDVIGRLKLDERRWTYAVEAPFDTACDIPELIGTRVILDKTVFEICGIVPNIPYAPVKAAELIELLVRQV